MSSRELQWNISGKDVTVRIGDGTFQIADQTITYQRIDANTLDISGRRVRFHVVRDGNSCTVWLGGRTYHLQRATTPHHAETAAAATGEVAALMPALRRSAASRARWSTWAKSSWLSIKMI